MNNMKIDLMEKRGLQIEDKEIMLGGSIEVAKEVLGEHDIFDGNYYFLDGILMFSVDNLGKIKEIEVRNSDDDRIFFMFRTLEIFKEEKDMLLRYFSDIHEVPFAIDNCTYYVENLGIEFSFGMSDEDIKDLIAESKNDGVYEEMKEEIEQDIYRSKHIESFLMKK